MRSLSALFALSVLASSGCSEPLTTATALSPIFASPNYVAIVVDGFATRPENTTLTAGFATLTPTMQPRLEQAGRCVLLDTTPPPNQAREPHFAGDIAIDLGSRATLLTGTGTQYVSTAVLPAAPGTPIAVTLPNAAATMGTFAGSIAAVAPVALAPGAWHDQDAHARTDDLTIAWTPPATDRGLVVLDLQNEAQLIQCQVPVAEGRAVIPHALLAKVPAGNAHGFLFVVDHARVTSSNGDEIELSYTVSPTYAGVNFPRFAVTLVD